jgi:hypothetical protein
LYSLLRSFLSLRVYSSSCSHTKVSLLSLKFILYSYHTIFIGQSTLALALLVLKADCLPENSYFPVGCVDNRCACYSCVIYLLLRRL